VNVLEGAITDWFALIFVENFSYTSVKRDFAELPKQGK